MQIDKRPDFVPIGNDEKTTITLTGSELAVICDALTLLQKQCVEKAYSYTHSEDSSNSKFNFSSVLADMNNIHALLSELDKLFDIPF